MDRNGRVIPGDFNSLWLQVGRIGFMIPSEIAIPFRLDTSGQVATVNTPDQQINQHVFSLVNTSPSERTVIGDYGIPLTQNLFENDPALVASEVELQIQSALNQWEPGIALIETNTTPAGPGNVTATLSVVYSRTDAPDTGLQGQRSNVVTVGPGGTVVERVSA